MVELYRRDGDVEMWRAETRDRWLVEWTGTEGERFRPCRMESFASADAARAALATREAERRQTGVVERAKLPLPEGPGLVDRTDEDLPEEPDLAVVATPWQDDDGIGAVELGGGWVVKDPETNWMELYRTADEEPEEIASATTGPVLLLGKFGERALLWDRDDQRLMIYRVDGDQLVEVAKIDNVPRQIESWDYRAGRLFIRDDDGELHEVIGI